MRYRPAMLAFLTAQIVHMPVHAATRNDAPADQEVIRMLELLREMEMLKQMDLLKDINSLPATGEGQKISRPQGPEVMEKKASKR